MRACPFSSTTAAMSGRIATAIPHRQQAAEIEGRLRGYRPLWDLLCRPGLLEAVLALAADDHADWWRPAQLGLLALAASRQLPGAAAAHSWLVSDLLDPAAENGLVQDLAGEPLFAEGLVRDLCAATFHLNYSQAPLGDAAVVCLSEGVLICLYGLEAAKGLAPMWLSAVAQRRPAVAAHILLHNSSADRVMPAAHQVADKLSPIKALAFIDAWREAGETEAANELSAELLKSLPLLSENSHVEHLAQAAVLGLYRGRAAAASEPDAAVSELERAWDSVRGLAAALAQELGYTHHLRSDPLAALAAFQLGLSFTPGSQQLRAAAAQALNAQNRYQETLDMVSAAPVAQTEKDWSLALARAQALFGLGQVEAAGQAAGRLGDLAATPQQQQQAGLLLAQLDQLQAAIVHLEQALQARPGRANWYGDLGGLYAQNGDWPAAENCHRQQIALDPRNVAAYLQLVTVLRSQRDLSSALQVATEAAQLDPRKPDTLLAWAETAHEAACWETTIRAGAAALALQPDSAQLHVLVGQAYAEQGQDKQALFHLCQATELPTEPGEASQPWLALAEFHQGQNQALAEQTLVDGLQVVGNHASPLLARLAQLYQETGRLTEAQSTYQLAYQAGGRESDMLVRYGRVLSSLGHHQEAISHLEEAVSRPDAGGETYHSLSLVLEKAGHTMEAAAAVRQAAKLLPADGRVLLDAGRLCLIDKDSKGAVDALEAAAQHLPQVPQVWELLGQARMVREEWEAAVDDFWRASRLDPANAQLQHNIGLASIYLGQHETAITVLREVADRLPDDLAVQESLSDALEAAGWWSEAALVRQKAAQLAQGDPQRTLAWARTARQANDLAASQEALDLARQIDPQSKSLLLEQALLQRAHRDPAGAIQSLQELIKDCDDPDLLQPAGESLIDLGQSQLAMTAFGRLAELDPDDPAGQVRLAQLSAEMGNKVQALASYQKAVDLQPTNPAYQVAIAQVYWDMGQYAQAAQAWETALELQPADTGAIYQLGHVYARMGDPAAALEMFEQAAALPDNPDAPTGPAWREAGRSALTLGELSKACTCLARALQQLPHDPETHSLLGALADQLGKPEEALDAYREAAERAPDVRAYQLQLADALSQRGQDLDAVNIWEKILGVDVQADTATEMLVQMGDLYARAGRYQDAERVLRQALDQSPNAASEIQAQLASVLVEQAERIDYQQRAAIKVVEPWPDLDQAVVWLAQVETPQGQRDLARARLLTGRVNEAITGLSSYLSSTRSDLSAQRALGVAYRPAGLLERSFDVLSTALRLAPNDARTTVELAQTYVAMGKPATAVTLLDRLASQLPEQAIVLYHLAKAHEAVGDRPAAIAALHQAVDCQPTVANWLGTLSAWLRGHGQPSIALGYAESAAELEPGAAAKAELAQVMADLGRIKDAIHHWQAAVQLETDVADWWQTLGDLLLEDGQPGPAAECFAQAVQLQPKEAGPYQGGAKAMLALGQLDEAGQLAHKALDLAPDLPAAHACLGEWQAANGEWHHALVSFQKAIFQASQNGINALPAERAVYLLQVARAYRALGSHEQALQELERAVGLAPSLGPAYVLMGDIHLAQDSRDQARQAYQQAAQADPANATVLLQLAQFLQSEGQLDQALDWLIKAVAVRPAAELWLAAAEIYRQRGQRGKHLEALHRAVDLEADHGEALYELGLAYKQRKKYQMAIEAFEKVAQLQPNNTKAHKQLSAVVAISLAGRISMGDAGQLSAGR